MSEQTDIVLSSHGLTKTFDEGGLRVNVLKDVNFAVRPGELVAITGVSGAGKSTLLHCLGGLDKPTEGHVIIAGHNMSTMPEKAKGVLRNQYLGFIYQFHHLLPEFNALENVCMPLLIRGMKPKQAIEKATAIIGKVGLEHRLQHRIGELSGGERQRIAIARALVTEPHCVLADEPTGNLDNKTAEQVFDLMLHLNKDLNTSFIVVTHNQSLADRMDTHWQLGDGSLVKK